MSGNVRLSPALPLSLLFLFVIPEGDLLLPSPLHRGTPRFQPWVSQMHQKRGTLAPAVSPPPADAHQQTSIPTLFSTSYPQKTTRDSPQPPPNLSPHQVQKKHQRKQPLHQKKPSMQAGKQK